ncbi:MAG TPA: ClpXP protease specificity-enhancing factor SspB [Xanthobacteraceae bacterium]|nr:ClpXP protease specificity-enhancing factor SspB [Xanthobacteraceae bacterium]
MPTDHIRYDLLAQSALRGVVRTVMTDAAKRGLPGEHHFKISFDTNAPGVRLSARLREQYPEEMTIILQHQFWDLTVGNDAFEVGLSFGGIPERLRVPFNAIIAFFDPAVNFGLQFVKVPEDTESAVPAVSTQPPRLHERKAPREKPKAAAPAAPAATEETAGDNPDKPTGGGEVVRLDRFRKK